MVDCADYDLETASIDTLRFRVVLANSTVSIECCGVRIYTHTFRGAEWPDIATAKIYSIDGIELSSVIVSELRDSREAVFIDYESNADSAIQSIIQQRPVQIFAEVGREVSFTYSAARNTAGAHHINSYSETTRDNAQLSSDGLVYYTDVAISISKETAEQVGLITKLYRLSELNNGALNAASRLQQVALEKRKSITIACRLDPRYQIADRLLINQVLTGTGTELSDDIIIEDITINIQNGNYSMSITGRRRFYLCHLES